MSFEFAVRRRRHFTRDQLKTQDSKLTCCPARIARMITHEIIGDDMQAVIMTLGAGDEVRAEAGAMTFMSDGIEMDARMQGGLLGGLKRKFLAGESLFLTFFKSTVASARVAFSGPFP